MKRKGARKKKTSRGGRGRGEMKILGDEWSGVREEVQWKRRGEEKEVR